MPQLTINNRGVTSFSFHNRSSFLHISIVFEAKKTVIESVFAKLTRNGVSGILNDV